MTKGKRLFARTAALSHALIAISHPIRTAIVFNLLKQPLEMWEIVDMLKESAPTVSHHIDILHQAGWVKRVRIGKHVTYSLQKTLFMLLQKEFTVSDFCRTIYQT